MGAKFELLTSAHGNMIFRLPLNSLVYLSGFTRTRVAMDATLAIEVSLSDRLVRVFLVLGACGGGLLQWGDRLIFSSFSVRLAFFHRP